MMGPTAGVVDATNQEMRLQALQDAKAVVHTQVQRFRASSVLPFNRYKYFVGVAKTYVSVYIIGAFPQHYWKWHCVQLLLLTPIHAYRWLRTCQLAHFVEFCWVANLCIALYLLLCIMAPDVIPADLRGRAARCIFAFGTGPLGGAAMMLGNALIPHSVDHTMSLLIHMQPLVTAYTLAHKLDSAGQQMFPLYASGGEAVIFSEYMALPVQFYLCWVTFHICFMLTWGLSLEKKGYITTYHYNLSPPAGKHNQFTSVLGRCGGGGSEVLRFLKYEVISVLMNVTITSCTYLLYKHDRSGAVQFALMLLIGLVACFNGASWYSKNFQRLDNCLDKLIADASTSTTSPEAAKKQQ